MKIYLIVICYRFSPYNTLLFYTNADPKHWSAPTSIIQKRQSTGDLKDQKWPFPHWMAVTIAFQGREKPSLFFIHVHKKITPTIKNTNTSKEKRENIEIKIGILLGGGVPSPHARKILVTLYSLFTLFCFSIFFFSCACYSYSNSCVWT